jgi:hypothetical protein
VRRDSAFPPYFRFPLSAFRFRMSFRVRYYITDEDDLSLVDLQIGLQEFDPAYSVPHEDDAGEVHYAGEPYAEVEINRRGEELFDEEMEETIDSVALTGGPRAQHILDTLRAAQQVVVLKILYQGRDPEQTLTRIDPVPVWLMMNREGLLQVDGEGFYEGEELIFEME